MDWFLSQNVNKIFILLLHNFWTLLNFFPIQTDDFVRNKTFLSSFRFPTKIMFLLKEQYPPCNFV